MAMGRSRRNCVMNQTIGSGPDVLNEMAVPPELTTRPVNVNAGNAGFRAKRLLQDLGHELVVADGHARSAGEPRENQKLGMGEVDYPLVDRHAPPAHVDAERSHFERRGAVLDIGTWPPHHSGASR